MIKLIEELKCMRAYYEKCASDSADFSTQDMYISKSEAVLVEIVNIQNGL